ncbi:Anoctamin-5 [Papilio xuthus]|uniref:Anoctamin-5 n=1 Tax=Papilio xuthus TaxID=66420 RepID=A0A194PIK7_PAPXU|nr:Anoctamin-5 [Papilio xuthus]
MSDKLGKEKWTIERMTMEAAEDSTPDYNESTVPPKNNPGRTFRDGVRKIDLILVVKDEENIITDTMKNNFLTNIVKTGFEIEFEKGVIARAEHIMSYNEREWINLIRKQYTQPLEYSSLERSLVVYMTLLNVPFGDRQNYIGLERLMKRNIVIDAYALHDGPYFITQDATNINARQILFYNWVGFRNIFTRQPLNVVHEYFGPKIYGKVASYIVRMENHKSYASCSRSLAKQQYIMCLPVPLMVLFSYGYHPILMAAIFLILQYIFSIDVDEKEIPKKRERENYDESRSNSGT